ncbi:MAG: peptidylprolyl isomerase [Candidatus Omnitrophota bacterium]|nr:peptidylprolyl isomerase [Candidatus Omnitrophota bacterium]
MLKFFRKKMVMKVILWGLVIIVVPAFVMWGGASSSRSKGNGPGYVGVVNDRKVLFDELSGALSGVRSQIILSYFNQPKTLDTLLSNKSILAKLAWDRILMLEEVKRAGIKISDKELVETIRSHPLFIRNGAFDDKFYAYILRNNIGLEPRSFEEIVRENVSLQKLSASITKDVKVSDSDILAEYKKDFQNLKISYILLEVKNFLDKVKIGEDAAKDFYEKRKSEFRIKSDLKGSSSDRQATFEESKEAIENHLKEVEARSMLKKRADEIYAGLIEKMKGAGETFQKAAAKLNLTVSETDFFSKKDTVEAVGDTPVIIEASSDLKDFELSKPVEIAKGYIIFEVAGKKDADEETFKKDKEEYSKKVWDLRSNMVLEKWLKALEDRAKLAIKLDETEKNYR